MEWVNVTAKTLPEAIDLALDNLGVDEAEAEIEVLEEPKQGLFGRTRGNARVKARVKPKTTRPKVERNRGRRRSNDGGSGKGSGQGQGQGRGRGDKTSREGGRDRSESKPRNEQSDRGEKRSGGSGGGGGGSRSGGGSNRGGRSKQRQDQAPVKEVPVEEVAAHIESFLTGLAEAFGVDGAVHVESDGDDGLVGMVDGQHGLMVGPKGRTLDAIQELTRVTAQRSTPSSVRIKVDVGGYREMRKGALQKFAAAVATEALADGKERALEPMSSADRKIVHDALNEIDGIETRSAGTEPRRRVVVVPMSRPDGEADSVTESATADRSGPDDDAAEASAGESAADDAAGAAESVADDGAAEAGVGESVADDAAADAGAAGSAADDVAADAGAAGSVADDVAVDAGAGESDEAVAEDDASGPTGVSAGTSTVVDGADESETVVD